jgi:hypothetical protein
MSREKFFKAEGLSPRAGIPDFIKTLPADALK